MPGVTITPELWSQFCLHIRAGLSVRKACAKDGMPSHEAVYQYMDQHREAVEQYARAKEAAADVLADEILDLADDTKQDPNRSKLQVDARKWVAAKLKPRKYGDKIDVEHSGSIGTFDALAEALKREKGAHRELPPMPPAVDPDDRSVTDDAGNSG